MVDNVEQIQITITAVDEATPVIEEVRAALADLATGIDLGSLSGQLAGLGDGLAGAGALSLGADAQQIADLGGGLLTAAEGAIPLVASLSDVAAATESVGRSMGRANKEEEMGTSRGGTRAIPVCSSSPSRSCWTIRAWRIPDGAETPRTPARRGCRHQGTRRGSRRSGSRMANREAQPHPSKCREHARRVSAVAAPAERGCASRGVMRQTGYAMVAGPIGG